MHHTQCTNVVLYKPCSCRQQLLQQAPVWRRCCQHSTRWPWRSHWQALGPWANEVPTCTAACRICADVTDVTEIHTSLGTRRPTAGCQRRCSAQRLSGAWSLCRVLFPYVMVFVLEEAAQSCCSRALLQGQALAGSVSPQGQGLLLCHLGIIADAHVGITGWRLGSLQFSRAVGRRAGQLLARSCGCGRELAGLH